MREIADKLQRDYGIPDCPLGVDGTMIRLGDKPLEMDLPTNTTRQDFWCRQVQKISDTVTIAHNTCNCQIFDN